MDLPVSAMAVANTFLEFASNERRSLTPMALQKHTYFAHAWYLGNTEIPLFTDSIQAWKWGPVIPSIYHAFKGFRNAPISRYGVQYCPKRKEMTVPKVEDEYLRAFLQRVWDIYKGFDPITLSALSHERAGPWDQIYHEDGGDPVRDAEIPTETIAAFYRKKVISQNQGTS